MNTDADISGLREQILANATILWPASDPPYCRFSNIVVKEGGPTQRYQALIASRQVATREESAVGAMAEGELGGSVGEALGSLLEVTACELGEMM